MKYELRTWNVPSLWRVSTGPTWSFSNAFCLRWKCTGVVVSSSSACASDASSQRAALVASAIRLSPPRLAGWIACSS